MGLRRAFIEYLRGQPTWFGAAPTYYNEIQDFLYSIGFDEVKNMEDEDIDKIYYNKIADIFLKYAKMATNKSEMLK
jgi:hypothetical protein